MQKPEIEYKIFQPNIYITDFVKAYWYFKINTQTPYPFDILPDGYFDILISFAEHQITDVQLTGIWDKRITVYYTGEVEIFGIRFMPLALDSIYNLRLNRLVNDADSVELKDFNLNQQAVTDYFYTSKAKLIQYLDKHFFNLMQSVQIKQRTKQIFEMIEKSSGIEPILNISQQLGVSTRQIHRIVNELLGLGAKDYAQIVRFRDNLKFTKNNNNNFLGFYDQSHFIKEFKKFTGTTPQNINIFDDVRFLQYSYHSIL